MTIPSTTANDYKVDLEVFEGPLDLLLYLIKKDELEICDIEINRITSQYVEYLGLMQMLDLNIAGEFIVMAATLMMIKSRMLLPVEERPEMDEEEVDPRWDLVRQLLEYKKFKDAARHLDVLSQCRENMFGRGGELPKFEPEPGLGLDEVSLFDLISALNDALKRISVTEFGTIVDEPYTVADKIEDLLKRTRSGMQFKLSDLFGQAVTRNEVTCTFLALLELIRLHQIRVRQHGEFGEIEISAFDPAEQPPTIPEPEIVPAPRRPIRRKKQKTSMADADLSDPQDPSDLSDGSDDIDEDEEEAEEGDARDQEGEEEESDVETKASEAEEGEEVEDEDGDEDDDEEEEDEDEDDEDDDEEEDEDEDDDEDDGDEDEDENPPDGVKDEA